ncbi:competence protein ComEC [Myroides profundi]|uniref:Competence protein ComEC n=1 Tax=Myroides profundi TaxID=480520 RepID=A0AAJ4W0J4_MYRPR|nr:competence protein ComEC [Myroides profundi]
MKPIKFSFLFYSIFLFLGIYLDLLISAFWVIAILCILLFVLMMSLMNRYLHFPSRFTGSKDVVLFISLFFFLGVGLKGLVKNQYESELLKIETYLNNPINSRINIKITETLSNKTNKRFIGELIRVGDTVCSNKIALYFNERQDSLRVGDVISYYGRVGSIQQPKNLGQFDYRKYMQGKGIFIQSYVGDYFVVGHEVHWRYEILKLRRSLINKIYLDNSALHENTKGLIMALLLGEKSYIDTTVLNQFKEVGVMHVLAISGLHVGLIYLVLARGLFFLPKRVRSIVILVLLWFFVFLSGFSASVFRAVLMFTIYLASQLLRREQDLEHSIGLALFCSLCIYPYWVYDIGFQLSYLAVISIVYILPLFKKFYSKNKILQYIQGITYVSISVQVGLIPIQLYYFQQFSFLFLLANLIVIPLITVLIILGMVYLIAMWVDSLSIVVSFCLNVLTDLLYRLIELVHRLDYFSFQNAQISFVQMALLLVLIGGALLTYYQKKLRYIVGGVLLCSALQLCTTLGSSKEDTLDAEIVVPFVSNKNNRSVWIRDHDTVHVLMNLIDSTDQRHLRDLDKYVQEYSLDKVVYHPLEGIAPSIQDKLLIIDNDRVAYSGVLDASVILFSGQPKINFERMLEVRLPKLVIFHNSVPFWFKRKCIDICIKKNIPFHDMYEKGYWSSLL